jgi:hypothetical protein
MESDHEIELLKHIKRACSKTSIDNTKVKKKKNKINKENKNTDKLNIISLK